MYGQFSSLYYIIKAIQWVLTQFFIRMAGSIKNHGILNRGPRVEVYIVP
jgi:hypothetical protein